MNLPVNNNKSNSTILRRWTTGNTQVMPLILPLRSFPPPLYLDSPQVDLNSTRSKKKHLVDVIDQVLDLLDAKEFEDVYHDHRTTASH